MSIAAVLRDGVAADVAAVTRMVQAGGGCTTCVPEIEEIVAAMLALPVSDERRAHNRRVCHDETVRHIEAALCGGVSRQLPAGVEVELVSISGLTVDLHLTSEDPSLRSRIAHRLQKLVCQDLQILFS